MKLIEQDRAYIATEQAERPLQRIVICAGRNEYGALSFAFVDSVQAVSVRAGDNGFGSESAQIEGSDGRRYCTSAACEISLADAAETMGQLARMAQRNMALA